DPSSYIHSPTPPSHHPSTPSLHDALPISSKIVTLVSTPVNIGDLFVIDGNVPRTAPRQITHVNDGLFSTLDLTAPEEFWYNGFRSEEHTSELQSPDHLVCRLLLEQKNKH